MNRCSCSPKLPSNARELPHFQLPPIVRSIHEDVGWGGIAAVLGHRAWREMMLDEHKYGHARGEESKGSHVRVMGRHMDAQFIRASGSGPVM